MDRYAKAIVAALVAFGATFEALSPDGVTANEWARIVVTTIIAGLSVWAIPNAKV